MAFVLPYTFQPNTKIESAKVNANFNAIAHALNGNLRDDNIADDADIKASKVHGLTNLQLEHWMTY